MVDFWTCLQVPCAAAAAIGMCGWTVEPGDERTVPRLSQQLDLTRWQFLHHGMRLHFG